MIRAALFDGPGQPLRIVENAKPELASGEVLVRVSLTTVCGSDLHTLAGKRIEPVPCVLGHEAVGVIEDASISGVLKVGDRVVWSVAASCGSCFFCVHGLPQKCEHLKKYGHVRQDGSRGPSGSFASHVHLWPGTAIVKVPVNVPDEVAAPASCATATVAACLSHIQEADSVLVLGCGLLGLTACAMLHAAGRNAVAVDADAERLRLAGAFGASSEPLPGRGADAVLEFTGSTEATLTGLSKLRTGGTLVLAGAVFPTPPLTLAPEQVIRKCLTIRGVHNYHPRDLQTAVDFLEKHHGSYPFASLVQAKFPLDDSQHAISHSMEFRPVRIGLLTNP